MIFSGAVSRISRGARSGFLLLGLMGGIGFPLTVAGKELPPQPLTRPYDLKGLLGRGEECFQNNNFREGLIFYFEALDAITDPGVRAKIHFRLGECLEGVRRYDFAAFHYKKAVLDGLPEVLASRAALKLKKLPEMAQHEEAMRLFQKAMAAYKRRDIRGCIDDYLKSLQLEPSLMAQDGSGLIDDAIQYLTYLSEAKDKEPSRLLKLATLMELRGETEKAVESLKQILIIYPDTPEAAEAEQKVAFYTQKRSTYLEVKRPKNALAEVSPVETPVLVDINLDFQDPGTISKDLPECAYTFRAANESPTIPARRFELFAMTLGKGENQKEFLFRSDEGISEKTVSHDDGTAVYSVTFAEVNLATAYIQDIYGEGRRSVPLFSGIRVHLAISRK